MYHVDNFSSIYGFLAPIMFDPLMIGCIQMKSDIIILWSQ